MITKHIFLAGLAALFISCSDDDAVSSFTDSTDISFAKYVYSTVTTPVDASLPENNYSGIFTIENNKFQARSFNGGASTQIYNYSNDLLTSVTGLTDGNRTFVYNAEGNLIGTDKSGENYTLNSRFSYPSANIVYVERLDRNYADAAAVAVVRIILEFDDLDNVTKAGIDTDFDGTMDSVNQFTYVDGNLVSALYSNGNVQTFQYGTVNDNLSFLNDNTFGKKVLRLLNAELYVSALGEDYNFSKSLFATDASAYTYDVLNNNFYTKRTKAEVYENYTKVISEEFIFN